MCSEQHIWKNEAKGESLSDDDGNQQQLLFWY